MCCENDLGSVNSGIVFGIPLLACVILSLGTHADGASTVFTRFGGVSGDRGGCLGLVGGANAAQGSNIGFFPKAHSKQITLAYFLLASAAS